MTPDGYKTLNDIIRNHLNMQSKPVCPTVPSLNKRLYVVCTARAQFPIF